MSGEHLFIRAICEDSERAMTYLVGSDLSEAVLVVDPGQPFEAIRATLDRFHKLCGGILLTHGHFDHIESLDKLNAYCGTLPVFLHTDDSDKLTDVKGNVSYLFGCSFVSKTKTTPIADGDVLSLCGLHIEVLHTPGHTRGSVCFLCSVGDEKLLLSGDTLFYGNVGRWDFPGGDEEMLRRSLHRLTDTLPEELRVYPGHGGPTTVGREKRTNYFILMG